MTSKVYTTDDKEYIATDIKPVTNAIGKGYRIETERDGCKVIVFYQEDEIVKIMTNVKE